MAPAHYKPVPTLSCFPLSCFVQSSYYYTTKTRTIPVPVAWQRLLTVDLIPVELIINIPTINHFHAFKFGGSLGGFVHFSVAKATLQPPMSVRSSVRPSETKTPKQLKINYSTLPQHSPPLTPSHTTSHTPSHTSSQHNITTQHHSTTSQHNTT